MAAVKDIPEGYRILTEGSASILYEHDPAQGDKGEPVFYNKVQVLNRDLSIRMITLFARVRAMEIEQTGSLGGKKGNRKARGSQAGSTEKPSGVTPVDDASGGVTPVDPPAVPTSVVDDKLRAEAATNGIRIMDALAATGLRSIRYFKEIPGVKQVIVNDLEQAAVDAAKKNVAYNGLDLSQVTPSRGDANAAMLNAMTSEGGRPDVIDLDPYGSASPFIDAAVQSVNHGGMLCVTCTDMAVLCGSHPETCYAKYGSMPVKAKYHQEMALRIVLHALESSANRYKRHIVPVLCCGIDFYCRLFVRVYTSPAEVKNSCMKMKYVYQSVQCPSYHMQPVARQNGHTYAAALGPIAGANCSDTGAKYRMAGPLWGEALHNEAWVKQAIKDSQNSVTPIPTQTRLHGLLTAVSEELPDVPLYYVLPSLCETLHCTSPRMDDVKSALINAGYRVSAFHKEPNAIKTDAPSHVVWDVMRCWVAKHPISKKRKDNANAPGFAILAQEPKLKADFTRPKSVLRPKTKASRFPPNPEEEWGPKSRARSRKPSATAEKSGNGQQGTPSSIKNEALPDAKRAKTTENT